MRAIPWWARIKACAQAAALTLVVAAPGGQLVAPTAPSGCDLGAVSALCSSSHPAVQGSIPGAQVRGQVLTASGKLAPGAQLYATVLQGARFTPPGAAQILASTIAGQKGDFSLQLPTTPLVTTVAKNYAGHVDVVLTALLFSRTRPTYIGSNVVNLLLGAGNVLRATNPAVASVRLLPTPAGPAAGANEMSNCYDRISMLNWTYAYTTMGEMHTDTDMSAEFSDIYSAETDIDLGYSTDGQNWTAEGSAHMTNDKGSTNTESALLGHAFAYPVKVNYKYEKDKNEWACSGSPYIYTEYSVQPDYPSGGIEADTSNPLFYDDGASQYGDVENQPGVGSYDPGNHYEKYQGSTDRYSAAVTVFGFTAGASSVYSSNLKINWTFGTKYGFGQYHLFGYYTHPAPADATSVYAYAGPPPAGAEPDPCQVASPVSIRVPESSIWIRMPRPC